VAPGQQVPFDVRLTPQSAGSGKLEAIAIGEHSDPASDQVRVDVGAAAEAAARIVASLDPTALRSAIGHASILTVRLANEGSAADVVDISAAASAARVSPDQVEVSLQPGESAVRQIQLVPMADGMSTVQVHLVSQNGLDLSPIATLDALPGAPAPVSANHAESSTGSAAVAHRGSPAAGLPELASILAAGALVAMRRRGA